MTLYTPREAAERLRLSTDQLRNFVHDGEIRYVNVGRGRKRPRMMFTEEDITEFIERRTRRTVQCRSTNGREGASTRMNLKSEVIGFTARLAAKRDQKRKK